MKSLQDSTNDECGYIKHIILGNKCDNEDAFAVSEQDEKV